jgi:hypothetical protein
MSERELLVQSLPMQLAACLSSNMTVTGSTPTGCAIRLNQTAA